MIPSEWFDQARERITPHLVKTPLSVDPAKHIFLKLENLQVTGSFKARGALNKVLSLESWERQRGLVTASAGNHGQGLALAGRLVNAPVIVYASKQATPAKLAAIRSLGAELRLVEGGYSQAEQAGLAYATASGSTWISPYNDGQVIAGQATVAMEALDDLPATSEITWIVPVGGGGLISGISAYLKSERNLKTKSRIVGVQSVASPFMYNLYHHGSQEDTHELSSLADGLSGPVEENSITIPMVKKYVDDLILVEEHQISYAIAYAWQNYSQRIEGSAATALAAALFLATEDRPALIILSGGNIQPEIFDRILNTNNPNADKILVGNA